MSIESKIIENLRDRVYGVNGATATHGIADSVEAHRALDRLVRQGIVSEEIVKSSVFTGILYSYNQQRRVRPQLVAVK